MAEESIEFLRSIQVDTSGIVTAIDTSKLVRLNSVLSADVGAGSAMIASRSDASVALPQQLVHVINSSLVSGKNRFAALNVLVSLSRTPDPYYRSQVLFPSVLTLDASFEGLLMDREDANRQFGTALGKPHEHLVVLLLRLTDYETLKAADLLQQLCDNDDTMLAQLLLSIVRIKTHEWPLIVAAVRCLFELTLPQTYFSSESTQGSPDAIEVSSFQQKITTLLVHFMQGNTLKMFGDELTERWSTCLRQAPSVVSSSLPHFAQVIKYFCGMLLNLEEFCSKPPLQRTYQQSMVVQLSSTLVDFVASFVVVSISTSPLLLAPSGPSAATMCSAVLVCLRVLRFSFYKVRQLPPHITTCISNLIDTTTNRLGVLRQPPLVPCLLMVLELLTNVDAIANAELAPRLQTLLAVIAADDSRIGGVGCNATLSQTLSTLLLNETSVFVAMDNETTQCITAALCGAALDDMVDEIIQYIDRELQMLGLGQTVFEFSIPSADPQDLVFVPPPSAPDAISAPPAPSSYSTHHHHTQHSLPLTAAPTSPSLDAEPLLHKRHKSKRTHHPKEFVCMLTGKLMREPVVLKGSGHRFELEALEDVMATMGHVDPISGEVFDEDPEVDARLQAEIQRYKVTRSSKRRAGAADA